MIVHENCHFLFDAMPQQRRAQLESAAQSLQAPGEPAWQVLGEALPTAIGQGVADRTFRPKEWSRNAPWYHRADVDGYAKALHGPANHAIATGLKFDEAFLRHAILIWAQHARNEGPKIIGIENAPSGSPPAPTHQ